MNRFCGNCFNESLNDQRICTICGFDDHSNWDKAPHGLPAGSILNGRYIIGKVLGQGGFGITYTARDHQTGQLVAVKEFFPDSMATRTGRTTVTPFSGDRGESFAYGKECFLREAQTMAEFIGNPIIVRVYSYFEENGTAYFVMEYVDGMSFQEYLKSKGGAISLEEALEILYPVMDALSAVHEKGIIHRDIAPDNIYISKTGEVKLLDFGAARYSLGNVSRSLDVILKHGFAPREQYKRRGRQGPYTDVYSTAATLYYAITGSRPDDALERQDEDDMPLPSSLGAKISPAQEDVLLKAMEVNAEDRYQTMREFKNALKRAKPPVGESKKTSSEKPKAVEIDQSKPEKKKNPLWLISIAVVMVCFAIAAFVLKGIPVVTDDNEMAAISMANILMPVEEKINSSEAEFLNLNISRGNVRSITFLNTFIDAPDNAVDVSAAGNRTVLAWSSTDGGQYDVCIAAKGDVIAPKNSSQLFAYMSRLESIVFNDAFDTSMVTDMSNLFSDDVNLRAVDLKGFDTSNVTNMSRMFNSCMKITDLDLSSFCTSNVTSMSGMFRYCWALSKLDMSNLDTSHVTFMNSMFQGCNSLKNLDVTGFDTSNVINMASLFSDCENLQELDLSHFDTSSVTNMSSMFRDCTHMKVLDLSRFDTSNVTDMSSMFENCYRLEELNVSGFNTAKVTQMQHMFYYCRSLKNFNATKFPVNIKTTNTTFMFSGVPFMIPSWY